MTTLTLDLYIRALSIKDDEEVNVSQSKELRMRWMKTLAAFLLLFPAHVFADEEAEVLPERYSELGLEPLEQVFDFRYRSFRDGDRQSLVVRTRGREIYLLVFNGPISARNEGIAIPDRNLRAGFTRASILDRQGSLSRRVEAIYQLENREQENEVIKFLRAND